MSGFEIAGIVLGAFPLAISALGQYREIAKRLGLWNQIRLEYTKCSSQLKFHRVTLASNLRQLLLPLVADDAKIEALLSDPGGDAWREDGVDALLRKRLGDAYEPYFEFMTGMESTMEDLKQEMAMDEEAVQEKLNTPRIRITNRRPKDIMTKDELRFQLFKVKFSNSEAIREELFKQLQNYNNGLEKLLRASDREDELRRRRKLIQQTSSADSALCTFWRQATKLFKALASSWNCSCREQHHLGLLLQHRARKDSEFNIMFATLGSSNWGIHKTRITEGNEETSVSVKQAMKQMETVPLRGPKHRESIPVKSAMRPKRQAGCDKLLRPPPSIRITMADTDSYSSIFQEISTLCIPLDQIEDSCWGYLTGEDCRYYIYTVSHQTADSVTSVTLDQILRGEVYPRPTRRQRYALSLILASSFLQLAGTPWLPFLWKKSEIAFYTNINDRNVISLDQPHLSPNFSMLSSQESLTSLKNGVMLCQSLDQLGIMLLELCFGTVLEDQPCRKEWPVGDTEANRGGFDVLAARKWQYDVEEEAGQAYSEAVEWCLGKNRPDKWRQDMLQNVILPLQRSRDFLINNTGEGFP